MKLKTIHRTLIERAFRVSLSSFLLIGHGIPKALYWFGGISSWGPHTQFIPTRPFSGFAALIELICPLLIILGIQVRWAASFVVLMFIGFAFSRPLPWFFIRVPVEGYPVPNAVILSKEVALAYALAYLSLVLYARNQDPVWRRPKL